MEGKAREDNSVKRREITPRVERLITAGLAIGDETAQDAGSLGFLARAVVQATLPHKKVSGTEFVRVNGDYTLHMLAPSKPGLPYGTVPRLLLAWLSSEAIRTKSRDLDLGHSMSAFMAQIGMAATGGANGTINRFKDQANRLFRCTISASYNGERGGQVLDGEEGFRIADKSLTWWDPKHPQQAALWQSTVRLSEGFFNEIIRHPVPVDMRAVAALKRSPLALDLYSWLTYRASYAERASVIPWDKLALQFGSEYKALRQFRAAFLAELEKVQLVYPGARAVPVEGGLEVSPALSHVPRKRGKA